MPGWSTRRRPSHKLFVIDDPSVRSSRRQVPRLRHNSSPQQGCLLGTRRPEHSIHTGDAPPIRVLPRRLPFHWTEEVRRKVESMIASDAMEPSTSPWFSRFVLVAKKDGSVRFCVDYCQLNRVTKKNLHSSSVRGHSGSADRGRPLHPLVRGYWHIPVADQDRERTAFLIPDGLFQLRIMPFGLTNASATFRRATSTTLHDRNWLATTWFTWMTLLSLLARMGTPSEARRGVAAASNSMQGTRGIDAGATVRFRHRGNRHRPRKDQFTEGLIATPCLRPSPILGCPGYASNSSSTSQKWRRQAHRYWLTRDSTSP